MVKEAEDTKHLVEDQQSRLESLETMNSTFAKELEEAHDEIFRLQPYQEHISVRQASIEYDEVYDKVQTWVEKLLDPIMDDERIRAAVLQRARNDPRMINGLTRQLTPCERQALKFQGTEPHILTALVMRIVQKETWEKKFAGINQGELQFVSFIERNMGALEPHRGKWNLAVKLAEVIWTSIQNHLSFVLGEVKLTPP